MPYFGSAANQRLGPQPPPGQASRLPAPSPMAKGPQPPPGQMQAVGHRFIPAGQQGMMKPQFPQRPPVGMPYGQGMMMPQQFPQRPPMGMPQLPSGMMPQLPPGMMSQQFPQRPPMGMPQLPPGMMPQGPSTSMGLPRPYQNQPFGTAYTRPSFPISSLSGLSQGIMRSPMAGYMGQSYGYNAGFGGPWGFTGRSITPTELAPPEFDTPEIEEAGFFGGLF